MNVRTKKIVICAIIVLLSLFYLSTRNRTRYDDTNTQSKLVSLKSLLIASIKAAQIGGFEVVTVHDQVKFGIESKGKTKEGVNDPVTEADYRSHCAMYRSLTESFPQVTVISEEASKDCDHITISDIKDPFPYLINDNIFDVFVNPETVTIWIDPLDATKEFTENLLQYVTTMVCVAVEGAPLIGVIYKPFETNQNSSLFWALLNQGQSENLQNLPQPQDGKRIIIVSRSHAGEVQNISKMAFGDNVEIISAAGAGYKFLEVARGNATAYIHTTVIKKWDICAGTAILTALGGKVRQLHDTSPIEFAQSDSTVLTAGLLATIRDHAWYSNSILNSAFNKASGLPVSGI